MSRWTLQPDPLFLYPGGPLIASPLLAVMSLSCLQGTLFLVVLCTLWQ